MSTIWKILNISIVIIWTWNQAELNPSPAWAVQTGVKSGLSITVCRTHPVSVMCRPSMKERGQRNLRTPVFRTCCRAGPIWVNPSRSTLCHRDSSNLGQKHRQEEIIQSGSICNRLENYYSVLTVSEGPKQLHCNGEDTFHIQLVYMPQSCLYRLMLYDFWLGVKNIIWTLRTQSKM